MFGLLCNREGCPVAVEVFDGNTADPNTVGVHIEKLRRRFALSRVVLVGDRGMLTEARIREELAPAGFDWISALRAPAIRELMSSGAVQRSMFDDTDLAEIRCDAYPGERVHSFRTLLDDLATVANNRVVAPLADAKPFDLITRPTALQRKAFKLLGVRLERTQ